MDLLKLLNILIGLVTVYLVCALAVTALNEAIAAFLSSRARWLRKGVTALLTPPVQGQTFSERLTDALPPSPTREQQAALTQRVFESPLISHLGGTGLGGRFHPSYVPAWTLLQGTLEAASAGRVQVFSTLDAIRQAAEQLPDNAPLKVALRNLLEGCNGSLDEFRRRFEAWFSGFETQLGAWYKQKTYGVVIALSLGLAVSLNVDTVALARQMSADSQVLAKLVDQGVKWAGEAAPLDTTRRDQARQAYEQALAAEKAAPVASAASAVQLTDQKLQAWLDAQRQVEKQVQSRLAALDDTGLKLGWADGEWRRLRAQTGAALMTKLLGLLISALAISLGAPFWFDLLKQLVAIRSVGQNLSEQQQKAEDQRRADAAAAAAAEATRRR